MMKNARARPMFHFFEANGFGKIGSYLSTKISSWCNDLSEELVVLAMELAVEHSCKSWKYVEAILKDWINKGYQNRQDVLVAQMAFKQKKQKVHLPFEDDFLENMYKKQTLTPDEARTHNDLRKELEDDLKKYKQKNRV